MVVSSINKNFTIEKPDLHSSIKLPPKNTVCISAFPMCFQIGYFVSKQKCWRSAPPSTITTTSTYLPLAPSSSTTPSPHPARISCHPVHIIRPFPLQEAQSSSICQYPLHEFFQVFIIVLQIVSQMPRDITRGCPTFVLEILDDQPPGFYLCVCRRSVM